MRKLTLVTLLLLIATAAPAQEKSSQEAGVRAAIEHYFTGHATGDGANFRLAFHPEAKLFWIREGQLATRTSEEFAAGAKGTPAPDEAQRKRRIDFIDISGNAAIAKVTLHYPEVTFTDYMSLLKIGDEWKIVNKTFYADRKKSSRGGAGASQNREPMTMTSQTITAMQPGTFMNSWQCRSDSTGSYR